MSEHDEQALLFALLARYEQKYPILHWVHAIPNGSYFHGHWGTIRKAINEGLTKGVWDVFVPVAVDDKAGLYIEMKFGSNKLTDDQEAFREAVGEAYAWEVCYTGEEAARAIGEYLGIEDLKAVQS